MPEQQPSNVDVWLGRETPRIRKALESASRYFDSNDDLTVNTLEAVYGQENSFGILLGKRGSALSEGLQTTPVKSISERKKFILGAFNAGEGRIASAQRRVEKTGRNPQAWEDVARHLSRETQQYVKKVPLYEAEFALKSPANKNMKKKSVRKGKYRCTVGHWRTIDDRPVFICA